jgi:type IV pilus assembly protein PilM
MSRNEVKGFRIAVSVPGQMGLAKFFKPPPVEEKKIPDIVRYEARQQIPFDLNDVVWDFQTMAGSTIEEGYVLETEVGLFAMKREQAYRALKPFTDAGLEIDVLQLAPLSLYTMLTYDRLGEQMDGVTFDPDNPPKSTILLALGTDASDLIVTNGFRIWQRNMPLGGNHFTRQLTKDLKLTFAKAEHLKRNAKQADDPKLIFQAMRPVFNDLVTEVQRSVGFFQSLNKKAQVGEMVLAGNAVKLPGLVSYLNKNIGYDVHVLDKFQRLSGDDVLNAPAFKENMPSFGVCYGLCLQGLGLGPMRTSLVPRELLTERLIRAKKPWAVAAVAALLTGLVGHYYFTQQAWSNVHEKKWSSATQTATSAKQYSDQQKSEDETRVAKLKYLTTVGDEVAGQPDRRLLWLELLRVIDQVVPRGTPEYPDGNYPNPKEFPLQKRPDIQITEVESEHFPNLETWFKKPLADEFKEELRSWSALTSSPLPANLDSLPGPKGPGWVIQLKGYHYYNEERGKEGANWVRMTLINNLLRGEILLPAGPGGELVPFKTSELGIGFPILVGGDGVPKEVEVPNPDAEVSGMAGFGPGRPGPGMGGPSLGGSASINENEGTGTSSTSSSTAAGNQAASSDEPESFKVKRYDFTLWFVWQEKTLSERFEERLKAENQKKPPAASEDVAMTAL